MLPKSLRSNSFLALGSLVLVGLLAEVGLRLLAPLFPLPLQALVREEATQSAKSTLRVARGTRLILKKEDFEQGVDAVAVGDSMVFGTLVDEQSLFTTHLSRQTGLTVLNLGTGSTGPCAYNRMIRLAMNHLPAPPSVLLYTLFANDITEAPCSEHSDDALFVWESSYRVNPKLRLRMGREWLFQRSVIYHLVKRLVGFRHLQAGDDFDGIPFENDQLQFVFAPPSYWTPKVDLSQERVAEGLKRTFEKVEVAKGFVRNGKTRFVLVLMPFKEQVYLPGLIAQGELPAETYHESYDALYDEILRWAQEGRVCSVDLRLALRQAAFRGEKIYWTLDGHLTPAGHRTVASALAAHISSSLSNISSEENQPLGSETL